MFKRIATAAGILLACTGTSLAGPITRDEAMAMMARPGTWIEADGTFLPDGSLQAKEVEVYPACDKITCEGTTIYGAINNLDRAKSKMRVLGYVVAWNESTTVQDELKHKILTSKLEEGLGVKVRGDLQANGSFKATKIRLMKEKTVATGMKAKEKLFGPVTITDPRTGAMRVLNTTVTLRDNATFVEAVPTTQTGSSP